MKYRLYLILILFFLVIRTTLGGIPCENLSYSNHCFNIQNVSGNYTGYWNGIEFCLKLRSDTTYSYLESFHEVGTHSMGKWIIKNDSIIFLTDEDPAGPYRCLSNFTYTDTISPAKIVNSNCIKLFNLHEELDSIFDFPKVMPLKRINGKIFHD